MIPEALLLERNDWVPNNPRLPILLYRGVLPPATPEEMAHASSVCFKTMDGRRRGETACMAFIITIRRRTRSWALRQARRGCC